MINRRKKILQPPAQIGIIGGGQLGRMLTMAAKRMGYHVTILDPTPASPAGQVADNQIIASFSDQNAIRRLAELTDVVTYEFEHIDADILCCLESEGYSVYPSGKTLKKIQDKYKQKSLLKSVGLPVPAFSKVKSKEDIIQKFEEFGNALVLKTCSGGYDGKGNVIIRDKKDIETVYNTLKKNELMAEQFVEFTCELSIIAARGFDGEIVYYPVVENIHKNSILNLTRVPASIDNDIETEIKNIAKKVLEVLEDVGVFCIEMFLNSDGKIYINEIAPRPHNSGHYTIEGCVTSQFEQLIRIITGMPLGPAKLISPCAMVNILGNDMVQGKYTFEGIESVLAEEGCYLHLYGKHSTDELKKIGHITVLDDSLKKAEEKALKALENIKIKPL
jgi:5-(carboxyamino)imidazole ribonucleotide synthase